MKAVRYRVHQQEEAHVYVSGVDRESHLDIISGAQSIKRGRCYCKMRTMIISSDIRSRLRKQSCDALIS
jgi:hypothetical protein